MIVELGREKELALRGHEYIGQLKRMLVERPDSFLVPQWEKDIKEIEQFFLDHPEYAQKE